MTSECDRCGQEDPYCNCELYELRKRLDKHEEIIGKLAFVVFDLEKKIMASHSAQEVPGPRGAEASEKAHKDSAPRSGS